MRNAAAAEGVIACSLHHEGRIWPEASRIRVFMLIPGVEIPHLCFQCENYPCVKACPAGALSVNSGTGAVEVDSSKCTGCGLCV
ncbi:MAG: 4Fe-4S dicluster domain-containing protein, partial [Thermoproteota archaeon]